MTIDERNTLIEKAKTRKDGVYSYRTYLYVVKNNNLIGFSDYFGDCYSCHGAFNFTIGKCEKYERKQKLTQWLRSQ